MNITTLESIPVKPAVVTGETRLEPAGEPQSNPAESKTIRILIVDDEMSMRAMSCAIVSAVGYESVAVGSGEEAIKTYREHHERGETINAVVMDLALPGGISGLEATDALHKVDPNAKIIASSGYLQQNARTAAIERGFAGILP